MVKSQKLAINCEAFYYPNYLQPALAETILKTITDKGIASFQILPDVRWGKMIFTDQEVLDKGLVHDTRLCESEKWFPELESIRNELTTLLNWPFHTCVAIYYPDGNEGVDFHSDYPSFGDTSIIASISLGAERPFLLREKATGEVFSKTLEHGSLIVMGHGCQDLYEHALPLESGCKTPRINLTFRRVGLP